MKLFSIVSAALLLAACGSESPSTSGSSSSLTSALHLRLTVSSISGEPLTIPSTSLDGQQVTLSVDTDLSATASVGVGGGLVSYVGHVDGDRLVLATDCSGPVTDSCPTWETGGIHWRIDHIELVLSSGKATAHASGSGVAWTSSSYDVVGTELAVEDTTP
jgi:hypothetical protein